MIRQPRRPLTAEDRRVWAEVARSVRPLGARVMPPPGPPRPEAATAAPEARGAGTALSPRQPPRVPGLVPLERRAARALSRGQMRPDATLDLHGLTQAEAHARLTRFLQRAQQLGHGLVLVITGQGGAGGAAGERGVLRRVVPLWLRLPHLRGVVLGFEEAGPRQGGAGALYVKLRRGRSGG